MALTQGGIVPRMDIAQAVIEEMPDLNAFAAHRVFPIVPVGISTGPIPKVLRRARVERLYKPRYGQFPMSQLVVDAAGTFNCQESGFDEPLDAKDLEILGGMRGHDSARLIAAMKAVQIELLARDVALATTLMTTSTFGSGYNAAGVGTWGGGTDKPINDVSNAVEAARKACGVRPNRLLVSGGAWTKLLQSAQIQNNLRTIMGYTSIEGIGFQQQTKAVAMALGLGDGGDVIVAGAVKDTADEGQTKSLSDVWDSTKALVFYRAEPTDFVSPGLGRIFLWEQGIQYQNQGIATSSYDPLTGLIVEQVFDNLANIERMRAREYIDMLLLNKEAGYLITGI